MRARLFISFILVMLVSIISVSLIARQGTAREINAFMFRGVMLDPDALLESLKDYYELNGNWGQVGTLLRSLLIQEGIRGNSRMGLQFNNATVLLADAAGKIVFNSNPQGSGFELSDTERDSAFPIVSNGRISGYLFVDSDMGMRGTSAQLITRLNRAALSAAFIAGGLALILAFILSDRLIRPVHSLTQAATRLAQGDLTQRVPVKGNDELSELGQAFNHMAESLQHAEESRKAMTADIAHELRTPLSVQRAHLEALQDGIFPTSPENLQPILEQNLLLSRLVDDLRTLALADAGQLKLERSETNFLVLVNRVAERYNPTFQSQGVQLNVETAPDLSKHPPILHIDPFRVEQIIGNLLSNAQRFTPSGGVVKIKLDRSTSTIYLSVIDNGPGIPPEALPFIFDRFYRVDPSRSRTGGGSGLGLAIARQLAEAMGGNLAAANQPDGGANFTLELPVG